MGKIRVNKIFFSKNDFQACWGHLTYITINGSIVKSCFMFLVG